MKWFIILMLLSSNVYHGRYQGLLSPARVAYTSTLLMHAWLFTSGTSWRGGIDPPANAWVVMNSSASVRAITRIVSSLG